MQRRPGSDNDACPRGCYDPRKIAGHSALTRRRRLWGDWTPMSFFRTGLPALLAAFLLASCGGGSSPAVLPGPGPAPGPPPATVTISGSVAFQSVPLNTVTNGLNYAGTTNRPARGIRVQALSDTGAVLGQSVTDSLGRYSITVPSNTLVRIEAAAKMVRTGGPTLDFEVRDNVNGSALYVLAGNLVSSGVADSSRNLVAPSGWGGASYTSTRAAAPFAILDPIYDATTQINTASPGIVFPALQIFWSTQNKPADGDIFLGEISATSFGRIGGVRTILVLGDEDNDTDEYDGHVIAHEFGHYVQDAFSRDDSTGGPHSLSNRLDPRVAFSEGFGNAYSGMVRSDPIYRDSSGPQQSTGFRFDVESNATGAVGWYGETSSYSIIYDVFDAAADGPDTISAGFGPIFSTLTGAAFVDGTAATTIYSFTDALRAAPGISGAALDALMDAQSIFGRTPYGTGETNNGGIAVALPVYKDLVVGAAPINICSVDDAGTENKLGNTIFLRMILPAPRTVQFTMTRTSGPTGRDPDFVGDLRGVRVFSGLSGNVDTETTTVSLGAGDYVIFAEDFLNIDEAGPSGDVCFDFSAI